MRRSFADNIFKKHSDLILINLLSLVIGLLCYLFFDHKIEILTAIIATGISISIGIRQYAIEDDKIFRDLFSEFNKKYDNKFNDALNKIDQSFQAEESIEIDKSLIIDYLNLCSEEYLWYTKDRIPKQVWKAWKEGMVYFMNLPPINVIVLEQKSQEISYYGLFAAIGNRIEGWSDQ